VNALCTSSTSGGGGMRAFDVWCSEFPKLALKAG
jgi:hypothetical protein